MDITRHPHHKRRQSADRFLTAFSLSPPSTTTLSPTDNTDFNEDDIFFSTETFSPQTPTSLSSPTPLSLLSPHQKPFGILAATAPSPPRSVFNHTNHPSRMIPVIPRPLSTSDRQIRSLPVKVPMLKSLSKKFSRFGFGDGDDVSGEDGDVGDDDCDEMLPPHEMVARNLARSPVLSSSVLEGAGRTLKGRDLRQVRNAVFRQTGFID